MNLELKNLFRVGDRVELHPATDRWMMGDRFGTIVAIKRKLHIAMDRSGKTVTAHASSIGSVL